MLFNKVLRSAKILIAPMQKLEMDIAIHNDYYCLVSSYFRESVTNDDHAICNL